MTEDERKRLNALGVEVQILRILLLDLLWTVHGDGVVERTSTLLARSFPVFSPGDPEQVDKIEAFRRAIDHFIRDLETTRG